MIYVTCGMRCTIIGGKHEGKSCIVMFIRPDMGVDGFAEVQLLDNKGVTTKQKDLVPCQYLIPLGSALPLLASTQNPSGKNGTD